MATEVGEGYIDVEPRLNRAGFNRQLLLLQRSREAKITLRPDIDSKAILAKRAEFRRIGDALAKEFTIPMQQRIIRAHRDISAQIARDRRVETSYASAGDRAARAFATEMDKSFKESVMRGLGPRLDVKQIDRDVVRVSRRVDRHGRTMGERLGRELRNGIEGVLSLLPSRLETIFTRTGPVLGTVLLGSVAAGLAIGLPALGAMISGGLMAAIGTAAVAGGIALVAGDARVVAAAKRLKKVWTDNIWDSKAAGMFAVVTTRAIDKITASLKRWTPLINRMLVASSLFVGPMVNGLIRMVDGFIKPITKVMESRFMRDIMNIASAGFGQIGEAFGDFFSRWLTDPRAMEGAKIGLRDLFDLLSSAIRLSGDLLRSLSRIWALMNTDPDKNGRLLSPLNRMKQIWNDVWGLQKQLTGGIFKLGGALNEAGGKASVLREQFASIGRIWEASFGRQNVDIVKEFGKTIERNWLSMFVTWARVTAAGWGVLSQIWHAAVGRLLVFWNGAMLKIRALWNFTWGLVKIYFQSVWNGILATLGNAWAIFRRVMANGLGYVRTLWVNTWSALRTFTANVWNSITGTVSRAFSNLSRLIGRTLNTIRSSWVTAWTAMKNFLGGVWAGITSAVSRGFNAVLGIINRGINAINNVLGKLGIKQRIPNLPGLADGGFVRITGRSPANMAAGGRVRGPGGPKEDKIPAMLSNGEFVMSAKATRKNLGMLQAMNTGQVATFADGGIVGNLEMLFSPWTTILKKFLNPAIGLLTKGMPNDALGWLGQGMGTFLGKQIVPWVKGMFDKLVKTVTQSFTAHFVGGGGGGAGRWAGTVAQALAILHLPGNWLGPALTLIARESGGNPNAINLWDINAKRGDPSRGLMQTIGATFSAYRLPGLSSNIYDPLSNIVAGLRYIRSRYGTIFNVQQAVGATPRGYDEGGWLPTGVSLVRNNTGRPELVLNPQQQAALGGPTYVTVYLGDDILLDKVRAVVDGNNARVAQAFRRGRG